MSQPVQRHVPFLTQLQNPVSYTKPCIHINRPVYQALVQNLNPGDVLVIKSIDRPGRNYAESIDQWRLITREKKAAIVVLEVAMLDTRISKDLTGMLISDIVLELLSYVAETEREFIRNRQKEGIAAEK